MASGFHTQERKWKHRWEKKGRMAFREAASAAQKAGARGAHASGIFPERKSAKSEPRRRGVDRWVMLPQSRVQGAFSKLKKPEFLTQVDVLAPSAHTVFEPLVSWLTLHYSSVT